jgi:hypothetical protein
MAQIGRRIALVAGIVAMAMPLSSALAQDAQKQRCSVLHSYVSKYEFSDWGTKGNPRRLRCDVAVALCDRGDAAEGMAILEQEARAAKLPAR